MLRKSHISLEGSRIWLKLSRHCYHPRAVSSEPDEAKWITSSCLSVAGRARVMDPCYSKQCHSVYWQTDTAEETCWEVLYGGEKFPFIVLTEKTPKKKLKKGSAAPATMKHERTYSWGDVHKSSLLSAHRRLFSTQITITSLTVNSMSPNNDSFRDFWQEISWNLLELLAFLRNRSCNKLLKIATEGQIVAEQQLRNVQSSFVISVFSPGAHSASNLSNLAFQR